MNKWSLGKTALITTLCGIGHVLSSILLGIIAVIIGMPLAKVKALESFRGEIALWFLIGFGFAYFIWGLHLALKKKAHDHLHLGKTDIHLPEDQENIEGLADEKVNITPWILFIIFVLGPCEPLIPLIVYPIGKGDIYGAVIVSVIFGGITILTMLGIVLSAYLGLSKIKVSSMKKINRFSHALAGLAIFITGIAVKLLGL